MTHDGSARFFKLEEEITCSVCLHELTDPVSITCGHTFCRLCISSYWAAPQRKGHRCPKCRKVCPKKQLIPAYRLQNTASKVQLAAKQQSTLVPAHAVQMVYTDEQNKMWVNESVVDKCFLDSGISDYPLCLICVIGEKRRGKSSLLNYILRALLSLEKGRPVSLGGQDEPLSGFDWRSGTDSLTKGIWVWDRPFILERNGEKMAVFILDTEGSLDIEGDRETCIKLSALSMLLSSFLIFNVNSSLKATELDYLEMYLHVSELTGESFSLQSLQHLNFLIRDWHDFENCGQEAAKSYIERETEKLWKSANNRRVLDTLRSPSVSGFLLPHPGKAFLKSNQGRLSDMDEDFRSHLTTYVSDLVGKVWHHRKNNIQGERITCGQLGRILKDFVTVLQREGLRITTPMEMFYALENQKNMNNAIKTFQKRAAREAPITSSLLELMAATPSKMRDKVSAVATLLLTEYRQNVKGSNILERKKLVDELKTLLDQEVEKVCAEYSKNYFMKCAVGAGCAAGVGILSLYGGSMAKTMVTTAIGGFFALEAIGSQVGAVKGGAMENKEKKTSGMTNDGRHNNGSTSADAQKIVYL